MELDSRIIDQNIKTSFRKLLNATLAFIDTLLARNIQAQNTQAHQVEIFNQFQIASCGYNMTTYILK